jgi:hypothetical protein
MSIAMTRALRSVLLVALVLSAAPAFAQNDAGQTPPKAEPPPVADKGTTAQYNCLDESEKHVESGKKLFYRITLTNKCEQRLKCAVFAYQVGSKGPSQGHGTLVLAPKSKGAAATQVYELKIKSMGGMGAWSRECRII